MAGGLREGVLEGRGGMGGLSKESKGGKTTLSGGNTTSGVDTKVSLPGVTILSPAGDSKPGSLWSG